MKPPLTLLAEDAITFLALVGDNNGQVWTVAKEALRALRAPSTPENPYDCTWKEKRVVPYQPYPIRITKYAELSTSLLTGDGPLDVLPDDSYSLEPKEYPFGDGAVLAAFDPHTQDWWVMSWPLSQSQKKEG